MLWAGWGCFPQKLHASLSFGSNSGWPRSGIMVTGTSGPPGTGPELITFLAMQTQASQMYTWGPAISFLAPAWS